MLCTSQWLRLRLLLVASHVAPIRSWLEEFFYPQDDSESVLMINKTRSLSDFSNMIEFCQFICSNSWLIRVGWQSLRETSGEKDHPSCSFHHICEYSMYPKIRGLLSCSLVLCSHHRRTPWIQRRLSMKYLKKYEWFKSPWIQVPSLNSTGNPTRKRQFCFFIFISPVISWDWTM